MTPYLRKKEAAKYCAVDALVTGVTKRGRF
jgi:hypothetical protein